jgi:hypothetical protein
MNLFRRTSVFFALVGLIALLPAGRGTAATRSAKPKLKFTETFGDVRSRGGVAQAGVLQIDGVMPLTGVSLKSLNEETEFFVGLGGVTWAGTLGDDPKYRAGKTRAHFKDGGRDLAFEWNRRRLLITVTVHTERGEPGAFAETFMPAQDGPLKGSALWYTTFGERANRLQIKYQGTKSTRDGLRKVRLSGGGDTDCGCS